MDHRRLILGLMLTGIVSFLSSCEEEEELLTINGRVVNIDSLNAPASGVRVSLLDGSVRTDVPTGNDGRFTMRVPHGTRFKTLVDDFEGTTDRWFPLINFELPGITVHENLDDVILHALPQNVGAGLGSRAAWDNFLANCNDPQRPTFNANSVQESGGVLMLSLPRSANGTCTNTPNTQVTIDHTAFPVGYVDQAHFLNSEAIPDPSLGPCILLPSTQNTTPPTGESLVFSFGDHGFTGGNIHLRLHDLDGARHLQWDEYDIAMRPGTVTVVFAGSVNSVANMHFVDVFCTCGRLTGGACR